MVYWLVCSVTRNTRREVDAHGDRILFLASIAFGIGFFDDDSSESQSRFYNVLGGGLCVVAGVTMIVIENIKD